MEFFEMCKADGIWQIPLFGHGSYKVVKLSSELFLLMPVSYKCLRVDLGPFFIVSLRGSDLKVKLKMFYYNAQGVL